MGSLQASKLWAYSTPVYAKKIKIPTRGNQHSTTNNPNERSRQAAETGEMNHKLEDTGAKVGFHNGGRYYTTRPKEFLDVKRCG